MAKHQPIVDQLIRAIKAAERRGVTRYRIAKDAGLYQSQLTRLMNREAAPRLDTAERIATALGLKFTLTGR